MILSFTTKRSLAQARSVLFASMSFYPRMTQMKEDKDNEQEETERTKGRNRTTKDTKSTKGRRDV